MLLLIIKINLNFYAIKRQCERQTFSFFLFFYICFSFWKIRNNSSILYSSEFNFHKIIVFIFLQSQLLTFRFNSSNTNFTTAWKIRFIFFRASICNFITAKDKKDDDNENVFRDFFDKEILMIVFERSSMIIFCIDNMSFSAIRNFNVSRKIFFVYFSMIFNANNRYKFKKKKRQIERVARKTSKFVEIDLKKAKQIERSAKKT